ncbi:MAG: ATP-dependent DNA ligase, partial [Acidimicrobiales bacterium]
MKDSRVVELGEHSVAISNPDKVYFPELGATKSDLVSYYVEMADAIANTASGRPALLQRFPNGAGGPSFYQKRVPPGAPSWLQTTTVTTPNGTTSNALVVADIAHVLWAVNLGCIGLHLWPYHADDPAHADELRIDLDPQPGTSFDEVRAAALLTRALLLELGIVGYPKTTGNRGIHIYVRLQPRWTSYDVRAGAVALARELERRHPDLITSKWWKEERGERVFVDFNQNAPHKTVFGAWFARPRVGGQVSTPFSW